MQRLIILFFLLPWWAYVPLAGGVAYLGNEVYKHELQTEAERMAALELGAPDPVDLAVFDEDVHIGPADEVNVIGWINTEYNYTLTKRTNGVKTSERYLYMVFGMSDDPSSQSVRAAIVFDEADRDYFLDHIQDYIVSYQKDDPLFRFGGFARASNAMGSMVREAIDEQGLRRSDDFFYLEPFLAGREVALAAQGAPETARKQIWAIALAIAVLGLAKRVLGWGRKPNAASAPIDPRRAVQVQPPAGANKALDYDYTFKARRRDVDLSKDIAPDSPLGRIASRGAPPVGAAVEAAPVVGPQVTGEAADAIDAHLALRKHLIRTPIRFVLLLVASALGVWAVADKVGQDFVPLAVLGALGLVAIFAGASVFGLLSRAGARHKALKAARLSLRDVKAAMRADDAVDTPTPEAEEAPARVSGPGLLAGIGRGPKMAFWLAGLFAVLGYTNQGPATLVSLPINGYDPFADAQLMYGLAGVFVALTFVMWLRAGRGAAQETAPVIPRIEQEDMILPTSASMTDRLAGSRAWVRSAGKGKPSSPTAVNADMRDRMKVDPFERFAQQTRALR